MIQLSDHFTYRKLLRFTVPSVNMLIFTSVYCVADGFFVSNFAGQDAFTAVNFIMPYLMILGCFGYMFGTGGSALIARTLGEGNRKRANEIFSLIVYASAVCGLILAVLGMLLLKPIAWGLGARGRLLEDSVLYGSIFMLGIPMFIVQYEFQNLFVTAEKPHQGLYVTVAAGLTNIVLDALFVAAFSWGLAGAAAATVLSQCVGGIVPLVYFGRKNSSLLKLTKTHFDGMALLRTCTNGISELLNNIAMSLVGMLYNLQLLKYAGEAGVAANGVLMYVNFIFLAGFFGYAVGVCPVISYHFGAENHGELKNLLKKSAVIVVTASAVMFLAAELLARPLAILYVGYSESLMAMTVRAFRIYSISFLFSGIAIFGSAFFTALNNGFLSAALSVTRTLVFQVSMVLLLPPIWELDGIWASVVVGEGLAAAASVAAVIAKRKKYGYD